MLVEEEIIVNAPADKVYDIVKDMGRYAEFIPSLKEVTVLESGPNYTITKWVSKVQTFTLQWTERDTFFDDDRRIEYKLVEGAMKKFEGKWLVEPQADGTTKVHLDVDFELAMPALRDFLGPMAKKIMRDSLKALLQGVKAESERS
ncbi:type II toxin-antitoxin system RatA family toxin [Coprothermobacter platensis]|jgi:ribosome-associated toxin RatA of RatAB toxin-antitoxin module|uniref:type II toxin-antitoxin system RatA family toxin n=1 Tax=Coprothermobacter platensis TaxID=108819 RepID=UPI00037B46AE|nr:aromatase/cyclase [Coprothermobacter platensis]